MTDHLSEDQFAECCIGRGSVPQLQHVSECPECRAAVARFGETISQFQYAIRGQVDERMTSSPSNSLRPVVLATRGSGWRWLLTGATVAAVVLTAVITSDDKPQGPVPSISPDPQAIMDRVNLHLSRTVLAPMEPLLFVVPPAESESESSGGVR